MTGDPASPVTPSAPGVVRQHRDDPLLDSWLRRVQERFENAFVDRLALAYVEYSSSGVPEGPPADPVWSSVRAVAIMRRSLTLARAHEASSGASGQSLDDAPARVDALAELEAETWGAFLMTFLLADLHGRLDGGNLDPQQRALLRLVAPVTTLAAARQVVTVVAGVAEWAGAQGWVERAGVAQLLGKVPALVMHEGSGDFLAPDSSRPGGLHDGLAALMGRVSACLRKLEEPRLVAAGRQSVGALERAALWLESGKDRAVLQAGARRLTLTFARGLQLALLCEHAQWMLDREDDRRGYAAALRYSRLPVDLVHEVDPELDRVLLARPEAAE